MEEPQSCVYLLCCFICQDMSTEGENIKRGKSIPFKMFLRYLKIDLSQSSISDLFLCTSCCSKINGFWQLYQEFENMRLRLNESVQNLQCMMKKGVQKDFSDELGVSETFTSKNLKDAIIKNCTSKLRTRPRIKLHNTITPKLEEIETVPVPDASSQSSSFNFEIKIEPADVDFADVPEDPLSFAKPASPPPKRKKARKIYHHSALLKNGNPKIKKQPVVLRPCPICRRFHRRTNSLIHKGLCCSTQKDISCRKETLTLNPSFKCNYCNSTFHAAAKAHKHMYDTHLMEIYSNDIPPGTGESQLQAATSALTDKHIKLSSGKPIGCPYCSYSCTSVSFLKHHLQKKHFDKILIALDNPQDNTLEPVSLSQSFVNPTESRHIKCTYCERTFARKYQCRRHSVLRHALADFEDKLPPGTTQEELDKCLFTFTNEMKRDKIICCYCDKRFFRKYDLKAHLLIAHFENVLEKLHSRRGCLEAERINCCPKCGKCFKIKRSLRKHMEVFHNPEGQKKLPCLFCSKELASVSAQRKHQMMLHTFLHFQNELSLGTSEEMLESAVEEMLSSSKKPDGCSNRFECGSCMKPFGKQEFRWHVLSAHFEDVLAKINCNLLLYQEKSLQTTGKSTKEENEAESSSAIEYFAPLVIKTEAGDTDEDDDSRCNVTC